MTETQIKVLDQVHELLSEHFEGMVYVVDSDDGQDHEVRGGYNGGQSLAMGLCLHQLEVMKDKLRDRKDEEA